MRTDGRRSDELRPVSLETGVQRDPLGSVLARFGQTIVLCAATAGDRVPDWLSGKGRGWLTAEYAMLPGSSGSRVPRVQKGRAEEIQRLVGRSLRMALDLGALGERLITIDCDVIQADAGTRCAGITGGMVALELACRRLVQQGVIAGSPIRRRVCAVSVAVVEGEVLLDPDYGEDRRADVDMNLVFTDELRLVEVQGTAEAEPFDQRTLDGMVSLGRKGAERLFEVQNEILSRREGG